MMPVKAGLAICSSAIGVPGWCWSVAFMSSHYLDFSSCGIVPGFCKSGHIIQKLILIVFYDKLLKDQYSLIEQLNTR